MISNRNLTEVLIEQFIIHAPLYPQQLNWLKEYETERIVHLNGKRQSGRTSIGLGLILQTAIFQDNSKSLVITTNDRISNNVKSIFNILEELQESSSSHFSIEYSNSQGVQLDNGSRISFYTLNNYTQGLKGVRLDNVFLDICSPTMESINQEILSNIFPCIASSNGKLIVSLGQ